MALPGGKTWVTMRGTDHQHDKLFSYVRPDSRVPADHPLRTIRHRATFDPAREAAARPAAEFLVAVLNLLEVRGLLSAEHFSVDGTLIQAWASMKSFRRTDGNDQDAGPGRNGARDFHNDRRSNETHASTTDPDARLAKKSKGSEAKPAFAGHLLMENRNGLLVDARLTHATGTAECEAALDMLGHLPAAPQATMGADKAYDTARFVSTARDLGVTPHVAQNITAHRGSNIDGRTTRHDGYRLSQSIRKQIEEANGWIKNAFQNLLYFELS
jgi:hypothetical protein